MFSTFLLNECRCRFKRCLCAPLEYQNIISPTMKNLTFGLNISFLILTLFKLPFCLAGKDSTINFSDLQLKPGEVKPLSDYHGFHWQNAQAYRPADGIVSISGIGNILDFSNNFDNFNLITIGGILDGNTVPLTKRSSSTTKSLTMKSLNGPFQFKSVEMFACSNDITGGAACIAEPFVMTVSCYDGAGALVHQEKHEVTNPVGGVTRVVASAPLAVCSEVNYTIQVINHTATPSGGVGALGKSSRFLKKSMKQKRLQGIHLQVCIIGLVIAV